MSNNLPLGTFVCNNLVKILSVKNKLSVDQLPFKRRTYFCDGQHEFAQINQVDSGHWNTKVFSIQTIEMVMKESTTQLVFLLQQSAHVGLSKCTDMWKGNEYDKEYKTVFQREREREK